MDLFEHQAKELFAEYGVPVPSGKVAHTAAEAQAIAADFAAAGQPKVVVKAQVKTGGRGKAGGVKVAVGPDDAAEMAAQILGMDIKGHTVHKVLVEEASEIAQEYYLSFLLDRAGRQFMSICGGPPVHVDLLSPGRHGDRRGRPHQPGCRSEDRN